jgi:hypothetical protein
MPSVRFECSKTIDGREETEQQIGEKSGETGGSA